MLLLINLRGYIPFFFKKTKKFFLLNPKVYPLENIFPNFHRDPNNSSTMTCKFVCSTSIVAYTQRKTLNAIFSKSCFSKSAFAVTAIAQELFDRSSYFFFKLFVMIVPSS